MSDIVKQILSKPIQLADQVIKFAGEACINKQDCMELKSKTEKLAGLLYQAARARSDLYERPTKRIIDNTERVLDKALSLVLKCRNNGLFKRIFTIIPAGTFRKVSSQIENSAGDVSWLLRVSAPNESTDELLGLPPIGTNEPSLYFIWEQIVNLTTGTLEDRAEAAASLGSLARGNNGYRKLIIEECGVNSLLKLATEGKPEGQENAVLAIELLGRDPESIEHIIHAGVCSMFVKILKDGPMRVKAVVAWVVSEFVSRYPKCQDVFLGDNIIGLLVRLLAFETVKEHSKYAITSNKAASIRADAGAIASTSNSNSNGNNMKDQHKIREMEDPATKAYMKAMAARALWHLAIGNSAICRSITETRALLCFAVLLDKGPEDVQYNSAMAVMEISTVAKQDSELRKSAFKPNSRACKAVIEQLLKIIEKPDSKLLIPCVKSIGNLARIFRATESRMIQPLLVNLLDERENEITKAAVVALIRFACSENYLNIDHSKTIINAGGARHLIQLVYFGEQVVKIPALVLLCYIARHVPDSEDLVMAEVLTALKWASKQSVLIQDESVEYLLHDSKSKLQLYQSRGSRGFY